MISEPPKPWAAIFFRTAAAPLSALATALVACSTSNVSSTREAGSEAGSGIDAQSDTDTGDASPGMPGDESSAQSDSSFALDAACVAPENDAGTCSIVYPSGAVVAATCSSAEPPQPQGGTIVNGTYVLDTFTHYGNCPTRPDVASTTWSICGDHFDVAQLVPLNPNNPDAGTAPLLRLNFTGAVQGTTVTFTLACEPTGTTSNGLSPRGYTASPSRLVFIYPDASSPGAVLVSSYTRQ
jgi:hypothetical protein